MSPFSVILSEVRKTFASGKTKDVSFRIRQLESMLRMLKENESVFLNALHKDLRKSKMESHVMEIDYMKNEIIGTLREIRNWSKPLKVKKTLATILDESYVVPEPYGVVLVIGAWNYPLHLCLAPVIGAIAAGNCVLIKPSEISEHTTKAIAQILPGYLDKSCYKVVCGGIPETTELLKERFDYIFYTGSTNVGKIVGAAANKYLTPVTLELGGKSPVYVDQSADIKITAKRLLWGKAINVGQTCIAPDYVLCTKETEKALIKEMKVLHKEWFGMKASGSKDLGRIITEKHFNRLMDLIQNCSAKIEIGGNFDKSDLFIDLTVLSDVSPADPVMQEEIFGPILPMISVNDVDDAIEFINKKEKPLVIYVYEDDKEVQRKFKEQTSSGGLTFNDCLLQMSNDHLPFGGVGHSGMGAYHGKFSFDTFTHYKSVYARDFGWLGENVAAVRYPPYDENKLWVSQLLMKNIRLPSFDFLRYVTSFFFGAVASFIGLFIGNMNNRVEE